MIRKSKALGLALVAVFAMSAVIASAASASTFHAAKYPVTLSGSQTTTHVFSASGTSVSCEKATFAGSASADSSEVTIHPTYSGCTAFGFVGATVNTEECNYVFHSGATTNEKEEIYAGTTDVKCPAGQSIKVTASTCALEIKGQTGLSSVSFDNNAAGTETVGANVEKIANTVTKDGFLCPLNGTGNFTDGKYTGTTLVQGKDSEGKTDAIKVNM
jgi:hypothetical protein